MTIHSVINGNNFELPAIQCTCIRHQAGQSIPSSNGNNKAGLYGLLVRHLYCDMTENWMSGEVLNIRQYQKRQ